MEESVGSLPDHRWEVELKSNSYVASLIMPPYVFKRKVNKKVGLISSFSCNTCERLKPPVITYAKAIKYSENEDGKPSYKLLRVPDNHECLPQHEKDLVQNGMPSMEQCNGNLYTYRDTKYPPDPKTTVSLVLSNLE